MAFNPLNLLKLKGKYKVFKQDHPQMSEFGKKLKNEALMEGSVFSIHVKTPDGNEMETSIQLTKNDLEMINLFLKPESDGGEGK